jgi:hypothetical protein
MFITTLKGTVDLKMLLKRCWNPQCQRPLPDNFIFCNVTCMYEYNHPTENTVATIFYYIEQ